jgi:hypothetical protein
VVVLVRRRWRALLSDAERSHVSVSRAGVPAQRVRLGEQRSRGKDLGAKDLGELSSRWPVRWPAEVEGLES